MATDARAGFLFYDKQAKLKAKLKVKAKFKKYRTKCNNVHTQSCNLAALCKADVK